jgi:hypothetical protein
MGDSYEGGIPKSQSDYCFRLGISFLPCGSLRARVFNGNEGVAYLVLIEEGSNTELPQRILL